MRVGQPRVRGGETSPRTVWDNGGQVGVMDESGIIGTAAVYEPSLASERAGKGNGPRGSRSIPWTQFSVAKYGNVGGVVCFDWAQAIGDMPLRSSVPGVLPRRKQRVRHRRRRLQRGGNALAVIPCKDLQVVKANAAVIVEIALLPCGVALAVVPRESHQISEIDLAVAIGVTGADDLRVDRRAAVRVGDAEATGDR